MHPSDAPVVQCRRRLHVLLYVYRDHDVHLDSHSSVALRCVRVLGRCWGLLSLCFVLVLLAIWTQGQKQRQHEVLLSLLATQQQIDVHKAQ